MGRGAEWEMMVEEGRDRARHFFANVADGGAGIRRERSVEHNSGALQCAGDDRYTCTCKYDAWQMHCCWAVIGQNCWEYGWIV